MSEHVRLDTLPLFAPVARRTDPDTSHEAAASVSESAGAQREAIYAWLKRNGPATADAIDEAMGLRLTSAGRRLPELERMNLVDMLDESATTRTGRRAHKWRAKVSS